MLVFSCVFSSSYLQEWPQTTLFAVFLLRKGLLRCLEASKPQSSTKRRYLHGLLHLPATKPCILGWFQAMYASKWPQNTVNTINTSVSRVTPDSLLPFVHPLLSQVLWIYIYIYYLESWYMIYHIYIYIWYMIYEIVFCCSRFYAWGRSCGVLGSGAVPPLSLGPDKVHEYCLREELTLSFASV